MTPDRGLPGCQVARWPLSRSATWQPGNLATLVLTIFLALPASAHDFWIEPSTFHPAVGARVTAALRVGQKLNGDPVPRIPSYIERFFVLGSGGEGPMIGQPGLDPAGVTLIADPGLHWIGYQSNPNSVVLEAAKFEDYLRDEGLERIIDLRKKNGQWAAPGRERFYRCAKSLLETGGGTTPVFDAPLGFTLEIVPRKNPYAVHPGGDLPVTLLFRGKPAANILVVAMSKDDPEKAVRARTDAKGRVTLKLAHAGFWLIKAVHMEAAPADAGVDWQSWWASITFDVAGSPPK